MGDVSLKVLEKSWNFLFKKGYDPCTKPIVCLTFSLLSPCYFHRSPLIFKKTIHVSAAV